MTGHEYVPPTFDELVAAAPERTKRLLAQYDYRVAETTKPDEVASIPSKNNIPVDDRTPAQRARGILAKYREHYVRLEDFSNDT